MASITINYSIMSPPGNTDSDGPNEETALQSGVLEQRLDRFNSLEMTNQQHYPFHAYVGGDPQYHYGTSESIDIGQNAFAISSNAARNMGCVESVRHSTTRHDPLGEIQRIGAGSIMHDNGLEIDDNYDTLTEDLELNPLFDVHEPTTDFPLTRGFEETHEPLEYSRNAHRQENEGDGTVSAKIPNYYERDFLFSVHAHGRCASQCHEENMDTKPPAIDSTLFAQLQQHQKHFHNQPSNYPTQAAKNVPSFDRKNPPATTSFSEGRESSANKPKSPDDVSFSRRGNRYPTRSTNRTKEATTKESIVKKSQSTKFKRPSAQARNKMAKPDCNKYATSSISSSSRRRRIQPTPKQLKEAHTPRKFEALQTWFKRLKELIEFKDANGHTNVPQQYAENHSLGIWVNKQRMEKKAKDAGDPSSLTDEKIQLLEDVGFVWAKRKGQAAWEEKFRELQQYSQMHGHCNVPTKNKTNRALGRWVSTQRSNYKKYASGESPKHPRMDRVELEKRICRLEAIGFSWSLLPGTTRPSEDNSSNEEKESDKKTGDATKNEIAAGNNSECQGGVDTDYEEDIKIEAI